MPTAKKKTTREKAEEEGKSPPNVVAVNRGSVGAVMDDPVEHLREAHPDKEYRYVYAPEHRSDYSKLIARRSQGYTPVDMEEEDLPSFYSEAGTDARVGDVILCEIDKEKKEEREATLAKRAEEDARRAQQVFEQNVRSTKSQGLGPTPVGSIERTSREYSVETEE